MTPKTGKPDTSGSAGEPQRPSRYGKSGTEIRAMCKGLRHIPLMFLNTGWEKGTEDDRWIILLPYDGNIVPVKTNLRGYQHQGDLRQMALALLMQPEKIVENVVELPVITDVESVKQISILLPVPTVS